MKKRLFAYLAALLLILAVGVAVFAKVLRMWPCPQVGASESPPAGDRDR